MVGERINNKDEVGMSILALAIQRKIGWIIREIRKKDVGIDANIEQVINGIPTAKYISVQLKTGLGNVHQSSDGNFIFYFDEPHYLYWTSSSIPVILVLCDIDTDTLYWAPILKNRIKKTPKGYKIRIPRDSQLSEQTRQEFDILINTYQGESLIPDDMYLFSSDEKLEFAHNLMAECSESLKDISKEICALDDHYKSVVENGTIFLNSYSNECSKEQRDKFMSQSANTYAFKLNICKTRIKAESSIATESHIAALRLAEDLFYTGGEENNPVLSILLGELELEYNAIVSLISVLNSVFERFTSTPTMQNVVAIRAERSFALVIEDYTADLKSLSQLLKACIDQVKPKG